MNRLFGLINVTDADAGTFLQGQLTQDVRRLGTSHGLPAAWCNASGRVITFMRIFAGPGDSIAMIVPGPSVDGLLSRLSMFRLRARVALTPAGDDWRALATRSAEDFQALDAIGLLPEPGRFTCRRVNGLVAFDIGAAARCIEVCGSAATFEAAGLRLRDSLDDTGWQAALIAAGVPHIVGDTSEKYTAHMLNLDLLGAISFEKGCYTGQEVIARTRHLGQTRRRLLRYRLGSGQAAPGDRLVLAGRGAGEVVNVAGRELLAIVPLELRDETLHAGGYPAEPVELPYAIPSPR